MYTTEMTNALTPTNWFHKLYIHAETETDSNLPSGLEIGFIWIAVHLFRYILYRLL